MRFGYREEKKSTNIKKNIKETDKRARKFIKLTFKSEKFLKKMK